MSLNTKQIKEKISYLSKFSRLHTMHWTVVIGSLLLTFSAYHITKQQAMQKAEERFLRYSEQTLDLIDERMTKYEDALWAGVAMIKSHSYDIDYLKWKQFAHTLDIENKYSGINGIGVIKYIPKETFNNYLLNERTMRPNYKVHPPHEQTNYWPITYIEPVNSNKAAVGLDMAHENNRLTSLQRARDTGHPQITAPIILAQDADKTPGFLFYAPYYKGPSDTLEQRQNNFVGAVYAPFIMKKLMQGTLQKNKRQLNLKIYDQEQLLFSDEIDEPRSNSSLYSLQKNIRIHGREWCIKVESNNIFEQSVANNKPYIILIGGIMIDVLLLMFFLLLARSNRDTIKLSEQIAQQYKSKVDELDNTMTFQNIVIDTIPDAVFVKDKNYKIIQANPAFMGLYPDDMQDKVIGYTTYESHRPEEADKFLTYDRLAFENGFSETHESIMFPNGKRRILYTKKTRFTDVNGSEFILGVARDITDIQQAETALSYAKAYSSFIVSNIPYLIFELAHDGKIIDCNEFSADFMGKKQARMRGKNWLDFFGNPYKRMDEIQSNTRFKTHNSGKTIFWSALVDYDENSNEKRFTMIGKDMTEHEQNEANLRQRQKMQSLGHLAGGIAHELNNFLQPAMLSAEMLDMKYGDDQTTKESVNILVRNLNAAKQTVQDVLKFSRQDEDILTELDINHALNSAIEFTKSLISSSVIINFSRLDNKITDTYQIMATINENDIVRIFSNLLNNATSAMNHQGTINIQNTLLHARANNVHGVTKGQYLVIKVEDTGPGIPEDIIDHIFDPFFTTKAVGEGTGLGLSLVYGIVQKWGGKISVKNTKRKGACFTIYIPVEKYKKINF